MEHCLHEQEVSRVSELTQKLAAVKEFKCGVCMQNLSGLCVCLDVISI